MSDDKELIRNSLLSVFVKYLIDGWCLFKHISLAINLVMLFISPFTINIVHIYLRCFSNQCNCSDCFYMQIY